MIWAAKLDFLAKLTDGSLHLKQPFQNSLTAQFVRVSPYLGVEWGSVQKRALRKSCYWKHEQYYEHSTCHVSIGRDYENAWSGVSFNVSLALSGKVWELLRTSAAYFEKQIPYRPIFHPPQLDPEKPREARLHIRFWSNDLASPNLTASQYGEVG